MILGVLAGFLLLAWVLVESRSARPDGRVVEVHPYRKMLLFIAPTVTESTFQADLDVAAAGLDDFLETHPEFSITEVMVAALFRTLHEVPQMNRFVAGGRLYQRNQLAVSFSVKRKKGDPNAKVSLVKLAYDAPPTLPALSEDLQARLQVERSGKKTYADREYDLFSLVPHAVLKWAPSVMMWLDQRGLLPADFMKNDALFCSVFIANLGSLSMRAGHHHLFEWGNCPVFVTAGAVEWSAGASADGCVPQRILPLRITYDERIDDGLTARKGLRRLSALLEDPTQLLA